MSFKPQVIPQFFDHINESLSLQSELYQTQLLHSATSNGFRQRNPLTCLESNEFHPQHEPRVVEKDMEIMLKEAARHHELYKHRSVDEFNIQEYNSEHKNWASSFQSFDSNSSSLSDGEFRLMELEYCGDRDGMEVFNETWSSSSSSSSSLFSLSKSSNYPSHPSSASIHPSHDSHHGRRYSSPDPSPAPEILEPKPIFISSGRMTIEEAADEYLSSASDPLLTYTQTNLNDSYNQTENGEGLLNRSSTSFNHAFPINAWNWETIWKQPEASLDDDQIQQLLERGKSRIRMLLHHLVTPTNPPS